MDAATISGPQHMLALQRANRVRLARAQTKRKVAAGELDPAEVVLSCPWEVESMAISELLMSQKRWGRTRCRKFLTSIGLSETKTVGSLTERQRVTLSALLTAKAEERRQRLGGSPGSGGISGSRSAAAGDRASAAPSRLARRTA